MTSSAEFRLATGNAEVLALSGALTFATAARALQESRAALTPLVRSLDLAGLTHADSAGLAVIIALSRQVRQQGRQLRIDAAPASLTALAQLCDVDQLLALGQLQKTA
ncbi:MAG: STAS domain-containing protein [Tahibacter sp.]